MELFRQRLQGFTQQRHRFAAHRHLAPLRTEHRSFHADDIADVKFLKARVCLFAQFVPADIELQPAGGILQVAERHLAHHALAHHASGQTHLRVLQGVKFRTHPGSGAVEFKSGPLERVLPRLLQH